MNEKFRYYMPTKICFEEGGAFKADEWVVGSNILIISDPFLLKNGVAKKVAEGLSNKKISYFSDFEPNPSCESVNEATAEARRINADCVIAIGGGSCLDIAKAVSCLSKTTDSIYDYYGKEPKKFTERNVQLICIPTTSGTGSEVTNVGVFTNKAAGKKTPLLSQFFWPDIALIDSSITCSLPPAVTASTGMDAFSHAIEAYWNKESQPICDALALEAMKLVMENLENAYNQPENKEARGKMSLASVLAGVAFSQTRTTGGHAVSFPLTTDFNLSHGAACAITIPAFARISVEQRAEKMKYLAKFLGYESVDELADAIESLMNSVGMAVKLSQVGVDEKDIPYIVKVSMEAPIIHLTPATITEDSLTKLLRSIL